MLKSTAIDISLVTTPRTLFCLCVMADDRYLMKQEVEEMKQAVDGMQQAVDGMRQQQDVDGMQQQKQEVDCMQQEVRTPTKRKRQEEVDDDMMTPAADDDTKWVAQTIQKLTELGRTQHQDKATIPALTSALLAWATSKLDGHNKQGGADISTIGNKGGADISNKDGADSSNKDNGHGGHKDSAILLQKDPESTRAVSCFLCGEHAPHIFPITCGLGSTQATQCHL